MWIAETDGIIVMFLHEAGSNRRALGLAFAPRAEAAGHSRCPPGRVDRDERAPALRQAVDLLGRARVCHRVEATHATGAPLGAEVDDRRYKLVMIDVGLVSASLGISLADLDRGEDLVTANEGAIAEQAVGQALRVVEPPFHEPKLHYWARETPGSEAEVDYLIQHGARIVPIEVKAGATGALRSLHVLMAARAWKRAVRFNADRPSVTQVSTPTSGGDRASYELISLPLYLAASVGRILHGGEPRPRKR
jgi:hypothetical protein